MWQVLFPPFAAWWPNVFAWAIQTPVVTGAVWLVHRVMRRRTLEAQQASQHAHHQQIAALLAEHRRLMGVADATDPPPKSDAPTLGGC